MGQGWGKGEEMCVCVCTHVCTHTHPYLVHTDVTRDVTFPCTMYLSKATWEIMESESIDFPATDPGGSLMKNYRGNT